MHMAWQPRGGNKYTMFEHKINDPEISSVNLKKKILFVRIRKNKYKVV